MRTFHTFLKFDEDVITTAALTDEEIVVSVTKKEEDVSKSEDDGEDRIGEPVSVNQASEAVNLLTRFYEDCENTTPETFTMLTKMLKFISVHYINSRKQSKMTDFLV